MTASDADPLIQHVSDTAIWVAYYRSLESSRPDALFHDRLAPVLIGDRGKAIAESMRKLSRYTQWSVTIRTYVIDRLIAELVSGGIHTVVNLGAGLDTRPYRLTLPGLKRWIEVDYPTVVEHKNRALSGEKPSLALERIAMDLSDESARSGLFDALNAEGPPVLVLTEGVIPYLSEAQVGSLADWLHRQPCVSHWIAEFFAPAIYPHLQSKERQRHMKNAPLRFFPPDWLGHFKAHGWTPRIARFLPEEALKVGREMPHPWWARLLHLFMSSERLERARRSMGYFVYVK